MFNTLPVHVTFVADKSSEGEEGRSSLFSSRLFQKLYIFIRTTNSETQFKLCSSYLLPITVAARSKAWTVFALSNTAIVSPNPTQGMDVCERFSVFVLSSVYVAALQRADPPSKETYRLSIGVRNWKSGQVPQRL
jgi:hypothetical protein